MQLSWDVSVDGCGYQINRAVHGTQKYALIKTITDPLITTYKIRAYKKVGNRKVCGSFSVIKFVRVKK